MARPVFIIDGSRTPFLKARSGPGPFTPVDLAVQCGRPLLARQPFAPNAFDQVILGCVNVIADEMNPARVAALRLGMGEKMVAFTVQINCGSGMQSIDTGFRYIREGVSDLILAGGAEALSHAPLVWPAQGVRWDSTAESLAKLKPVFERPWAQVTAANSSQITDGASWVILASEEAVAKHGLTPKAVILDSQWAALDPSIMGLGPVMSATALLKRNELTLADIETWELNEAFATQVLGCLAAWNDEKFCREILGLDGAAGQIDHAKLNVDGGAISLGHPVGTSGNRIVLHLVNAMKRLGARRGVATECIGGGLGGAMLIETV